MQDLIWNRKGEENRMMSLSCKRKFPFFWITGDNSATYVPRVENWWMKDLIWSMASKKTSNKDIIKRREQGSGIGSSGLERWGLHWKGAEENSPGSFHRFTVWWSLGNLWLNTESNAYQGLECLLWRRIMVSRFVR